MQFENCVRQLGLQYFVRSYTGPSSVQKQKCVVFFSLYIREKQNKKHSNFMFTDLKE